MKVAGAILVGLIGLQLLVPTVILPVTAPDADAPAAVQQLLPDAKQALASGLDLPLAYVRYLGLETRDDDQLVILHLELRPWPYLASDMGFLASRCTPLEEIDPRGMSGGRGVVDFETDPELVHVRSEAQLDVEVAPECLPATNEVAVFNPGDKPSKAEQNAGVALHRSERESGVVYGTRTHNFRRHNPMLVLRIRAQIQPLPGP